MIVLPTPCKLNKFYSDVACLYNSIKAHDQILDHLKKHPLIALEDTTKLIRICDIVKRKLVDTGAVFQRYNELLTSFTSLKSRVVLDTDFIEYGEFLTALNGTYLPLINSSIDKLRELIHSKISILREHQAMVCVPYAVALEKEQLDAIDYR